MSIRTNLGRRLVNFTVTAGCFDKQSGELIQVMAQTPAATVSESFTEPQKYFISDLRGDNPREVSDVVASSLKAFDVPF